MGAFDKLQAGLDDGYRVRRGKATRGRLAVPLDVKVIRQVAKAQDQFATPIGYR
jgi:hypothetical protein